MKQTDKEYFGAVLSRIKLLESEIKMNYIDNIQLDTDSHRQKIFERLFELTFGTFFIIITWRSIEIILDLEFPNNLHGIIMLFLIWAILLLGIRLYLIKLDKEIKKDKENKEKVAKGLDKIYKKQEELEKKLFYS
ncbi:MAG: hypothetical protein ABH849_00650 [Nanoarchaeota archaeon]